MTVPSEIDRSHSFLLLSEGRLWRGRRGTVTEGAGSSPGAAAGLLKPQSEREWAQDLQGVRVGVGRTQSLSEAPGRMSYEGDCGPLREELQRSKSSVEPGLQGTAQLATHRPPAPHHSPHFILFSSFSSEKDGNK